MRFPLSRPRDTVPALLRPGEGVLVPEATQMLGGSRGINFLNRKAEAQTRMPVLHFKRGGTIQPELADERLRPDTNWLNDPREKEFSPEEELKYQFRDKLGLPVQHFTTGGTAQGMDPGSVEPPWLNQLPEFQGSYYPPDWMTADQGPKYPYYGYYGGSDENPQGAWSPYPNYSGNNSGKLYFNQPGDNAATSGDTYGDTLNRSNAWLDQYLADHGNGPYAGDVYHEGTGSGPEYSSGSGAPGGGGYSGGSGANWAGMSAYNPSYPYGSTGSGSGVPTQNFFGLLGSLIGAGAGSLIPGGGMLGSKLGGMGAKALTRMFQNQGANRSMVGGGSGGGVGGGSGMPSLPRGYSPFGGLPQGFTEGNRFGGGAPTFIGPGGGFGPQWAPGGSIFNANSLGDAPNAVSPSVGPYHSAGGVPAPGSIGGVFGQGSGGFEGTGHWDLLGNESMNRLMHGGDTSLGFAGMQNMNAGGNSVILPPSLWGGVGYGGNTGGGSNVSGGTITQRFKSKD